MASQTHQGNIAQLVLSRLNSLGIVKDAQVNPTVATFIRESITEYLTGHNLGIITTTHEYPKAG